MGEVRAVDLEATGEGECREVRWGEACDDEDKGQRGQGFANGEGALYLLKWSDTEVNKTQVCSVAQLRSDIQDNSNSTRHLFVLHGLPVDYTVTLRELGDADASFLDAHAGRRSYRSLRRPKAGWAHYDYPELVCQSGFHESREHEVVAKDLIGDPPTYVTSRTGRSVIFCRASIWLSEKVHSELLSLLPSRFYSRVRMNAKRRSIVVLYLDRPVWERPESGVSRMRYEVYTPEKNSSITTISQLDLHDSLTAVGNEIPTLEEMLCGSLRDGCSSRQGLLELLEDLAINKWGNFFETLSLDSSVGSNETTALFLQTLNCLERNLDVSRRRHEITIREGGMGSAAR
ncbi:hypothetical protein NUW58_g5309 [Xylaria curta]|uniref:Uncharacterized protein n=1 Tax=Xylaria curta TaxID=42375 RepID=A0ACC1P2B1_9PEZI|nr:hypothetical protein NUW58_g5309 [Xylaria curta]